MQSVIMIRIVYTFVYYIQHENNHRSHLPFAIRAHIAVHNKIVLVVDIDSIVVNVVRHVLFGYVTVCLMGTSWLLLCSYSMELFVWYSNVVHSIQHTVHSIQIIDIQPKPMTDCCD